jgi:ferrous iron transport protein A
VSRGECFDTGWISHIKVWDEYHLAIHINCDINLSMQLLNLAPDACAQIKKISGGKRLKSKLTQLGLHVGDSVHVLRRAPFGGPVLVECNGREVALGRGVAEKIIVELDECESP